MIIVLFQVFNILMVITSLVLCLNFYQCGEIDLRWTKLETYWKMMLLNLSEHIFEGFKLPFVVLIDHMME